MGRKSWEHGGWSYTNHGCRCRVCTDAHTEHVRAARDRRASQPVPEHVHGSENGYRNYRCHCDRCRAAHAANARKRREPASKGTGRCPS